MTENKLRKAILEAMKNIGVPQPGYPAPIAEAYMILQRALADAAIRAPEVMFCAACEKDHAGIEFVENDEEGNPKYRCPITGIAWYVVAPEEASAEWWHKWPDEKPPELEEVLVCPWPNQIIFIAMTEKDKWLIWKDRWKPLDNWPHDLYWQLLPALPRPASPSLPEERRELGPEDILQEGDYHEYDGHTGRLPVSKIWFGHPAKDIFTESHLWRPAPPRVQGEVEWWEYPMPGETAYVVKMPKAAKDQWWKLCSDAAGYSRALSALRMAEKALKCSNTTVELLKKLQDDTDFYDGCVETEERNTAALAAIAGVLKEEK